MDDFLNLFFINVVKMGFSIHLEDIKQVTFWADFKTNTVFIHHASLSNEAYVSVWVSSKLQSGSYSCYSILSCLMYDASFLLCHWFCNTNKIPFTVYFRGKVVIITNVASKWGKTPVNYSQFAEMHAKYAEKGLHILAFPSNQFGRQVRPGEQKRC